MSVRVNGLNMDTDEVSVSCLGGPLMANLAVMYLICQQSPPLESLLLWCAPPQDHS